MSCIQCPKEDPEAKEAFIMPHSQGGTKAYLLIMVESIVPNKGNDKFFLDKLVNMFRTLYSVMEII